MGLRVGLPRGLLEYVCVSRESASGKVAAQLLHRNPVKRRLIASPEQHRWSCFKDYVAGIRGVVGVDGKNSRPTHRDKAAMN